jgi:exopolysaccharide biosynthesis polyprenyl glycosylphosphotransferase
MTTVARSEQQLASRPALASSWEWRYRNKVVLVDFVLVVSAVLLAIPLRWRSNIGHESPLFLRPALLLPFVWAISLALSGAYEKRYLGLGPEEFKRVGNAAVRAIAVISFACFAYKLNVSRAYLGYAFMLATSFTLCGRYVSRKMLHARRIRGESCHRVLVIGSKHSVASLINTVRREPVAGYAIVGVCLDVDLTSLKVAGESVPVLGGLRQAAAAAQAVGASTIAVTASTAFGEEDLRRLAWELEGTGIELVVAPALTNVAGPRVHIRPVAGLPLLHLEEPDLEGRGQLLKTAMDRVVALVALAALSPLLVAIAAAIKVTSEGPALFRQERLGKNGRAFTIYKFRTMYVGAEREFTSLIEASDSQHGLFFKLTADPRVTRVGQWLRRYSLDELPQLINVFRGDMSLVGPRPLPVEVVQHEPDVVRRLLVRPGITGLWQVSGRSDLSPEEALRMDLYYVENWSLAFDLMILWKTAFVVIRGSGAY